MSTVKPLLEAGQRLDRATFHALYEQMPEHVKAELIGGVVYMASPLGLPHGEMTSTVVAWLANYRFRTPGVREADNATMILDDRSEPQPDVVLRILPDSGGSSRREVNYLAGAPELVIEISVSSLATDLGPKLEDYRRVGVQEYVVIVPAPLPCVIWHVRRGDDLIEKRPDPDGLFRSEVFPGLWLDPIGLLDEDADRLIAALALGLATPEHAAFVARLAATRGQV